MQFHDVWTTYKNFGKEFNYKKDPCRYYKDLKKAYGSRKLDPHAQTKFDYIINHQSYENILVEDLWYENHMVYYNVWPGVFDTFVKTRLDLKAELLRFSHPVFAIRLPKSQDALLSFDYQGKKAYVETIFIMGYPEKNGFIEMHMRVNYRVEGYPCPGVFTKMVNLPVDRTIEENFSIETVASYDNDNHLYVVPKYVMDACIRLSIAVVFLSTGSHKILEFDVLSKHLEAYRKETDKNSRVQYEDKAKKKGKNGWNIGSGRGDRGLKLPRGVNYEQACREAGGRELLYQHVRGGHWHAVRYGKGRKDIKMVYFEDIVVRKDLLPKPLNV